MNKVAVITGASSGIGRATAQEYAKNGYDLVLVARRGAELEEVVKECEPYGITAHPYVVDTSDENAVSELATYAQASLGHIDVWINGAGVYLFGKFDQVPLDDMRRLMDVNFFGYVHGSREALRLFKQQGYGTLINISSVNAKAPQPYVSVYSASKAAIRALDESLRMELILDGYENYIHVCTVMPASFDTNIFQNGANYSGKEVKALQPVYDPSYAAKHIALLAEAPKDEIVIGPIAKVMALQNALMPGMYQHQISKFTEKDMVASSDYAMVKSGNLYEPLETNRGTRGGWRERRIRADHFNVLAGAGIAAVASLSLLAVLFLSGPKHEK